MYIQYVRQTVGISLEILVIGPANFVALGWLLNLLSTNDINNKHNIIMNRLDKTSYH